MRPIVTYPAAVLREKAVGVPPPEQWLDYQLEMQQAARLHDGVGIAATQLGLPYRLIVVQGKFYADPVIESRTAATSVSEEGCLSLPGIKVKVRRHNGVGISWLDNKGKRRRNSLYGLSARIFQHEVDHLFGVLIIDHEDGARQVSTEEAATV